MAYRSASRSGFTLIELLIVMAIIGLLIGLLIPAVQRVRESAQRTQCQNNLKQIGLALISYHGTAGQFPPHRVYDSSNNAIHSWVPFTLQYLDQEPLFRSYTMNSPFYHASNRAAVVIQLPILNCPSAGLVRTVPITTPDNQTNTYASIDYSPVHAIDPGLIRTGMLEPEHLRSDVPANINNETEVQFAKRCGPMPNDPRKRKLDQISDGAGNTILVVESAGSPEHWIGRHQVTATGVTRAWANGGQTIDLDGFTLTNGTPPSSTRYGPCAINCDNVDEIYSFHMAAANVVFADGHVAAIRNSADIKVVAALVTRAGKEITRPDDFE